MRARTELDYKQEWNESKKEAGLGEGVEREQERSWTRRKNVTRARLNLDQEKEWNESNDGVGLGEEMKQDQERGWSRRRMKREQG